MKEGDFSLDTRRSSRVPVRIPVRVHVRTPNGTLQPFPAYTTIVNRHGARMESQRQFDIGEEVVVQVPSLGRSATGKVVWKQQKVNELGNYEFGVELERPGNVWGLQFPPIDWKYETRGVAAGSAPTESLAPSEAAELPPATPEEPISPDFAEVMKTTEAMEMASAASRSLDLTGVVASLFLGVEGGVASRENIPANDRPEPKPSAAFSPLREQGSPDKRPATASSGAAWEGENEMLPKHFPVAQVSPRAGQVADDEVPSNWLTVKAGPLSFKEADPDFPKPPTATLALEGAPKSANHRLLEVLSELVNSALQPTIQGTLEGLRTQAEARVGEVLTAALAQWQIQVQRSLSAQCKLLESQAAEIIRRSQQVLEEKTFQVLQTAGEEARRLPRAVSEQIAEATRNLTVELVQANKLRLEQDGEKITSEISLRLQQKVLAETTAALQPQLTELTTKLRQLFVQRIMTELKEEEARSIQQARDALEGIRQESVQLMRRDLGQWARQFAELISNKSTRVA